MPRGTIRTLSKEEYVAQAKEDLAEVRKCAGLLATIVQLADRAPDYSKALLAEVREAREAADKVVDALSNLESHMKIRGRTFLKDELAALKK